MTSASRRPSAAYGLLAALAVLAPAPAYAYIDPGAGGMMLQLLLAGTAGAAMVLKLFWRRIVSFFRKGPTEGEKKTPGADG